MLTRIVAMTVLFGSVSSNLKAKEAETLLAVFHQKQTNRLLLVNGQFQVKIFNAETRQVEKTFEVPMRKPYRFAAGGFEPTETFKIQRSFDERWLAVAYEPKGVEDEPSSIALQILIWDCQSGRIINRSEVPRGSNFHLGGYPHQIDFVLTEKGKLVYFKLFEKLLVWDIEKSESVREQKLDYSTHYYFDHKTSRIAWTQRSKVVLRDGITDHFLQEIPLHRLMADHVFFLEDGRILFAAYPDESGDKQITSPYPLLVCYDTARRRVLWTQPFDTIPFPLQTSPDGSQVLVGVGGQTYENDLKVPILDEARVVNQIIGQGRTLPFPWFSTCTINLKDGLNRVYRYKGFMFSTLTDFQFSIDGKQLAYIGSTGMGQANYASIVTVSNWKEIATLNLLEKGVVDRMVLLPDSQGILFWSKFGRGILHWNPSTGQLTQIYPKTIIPAEAEKRSRK